MTLTTDDIRNFMRDFPEFNPILDNNKEFTDDEINNAISRALSIFNSIPPVTMDYTLDMIPERLKTYFMYEVVAQLLRVRLFELQRNDLVYQSGSFAINYDNIINWYRTTIADLEQQAQQMFTQQKVYDNLNGLPGQLYSPGRTFGWW